MRSRFGSWSRIGCMCPGSGSTRRRRSSRGSRRTCSSRDRNFCIVTLRDGSRGGRMCICSGLQRKICKGSSKLRMLRRLANIRIGTECKGCHRKCSDRGRLSCIACLLGQSLAGRRSIRPGLWCRWSTRQGTWSIGHLLTRSLTHRISKEMRN